MNTPAARCLLFALIAAPSTARALEWELLLSNRFYAESIAEEILEAQLRVPNARNEQPKTHLAYQLHAIGAVRGRPTDLLGLELGLDTGLFDLSKDGLTADGAPIGERAKETLFLGETFVDLQFGETGVVELRAGKLRPRIGAGAIFDAYAFGVTADWDQSLVDRESPWRARLHAMLPDATFTAQSKQSPLFAAELGYELVEDSELRLFGAAFVDTENGLTPVLADAVFRGRLFAARDAIAAAFPNLGRSMFRDEVQGRVNEGYRSGVLRYDVESSGAIGWLGLTAKTKRDDYELAGAFIVGLGSIHMKSTANEGLRAVVDGIERELPRIGAIIAPILDPETERARDVSMLSYFADVTAKYHFSPEYAVDAFAVLMSGDRGLFDDGDRYSSFVGLAPLLPFTAIFFRGGVATSLASPAVVSSAPDGAGLGGGGVGVELTLAESFSAHLGGAALVATVPSRATSSSFYGLEANLETDVQVADFLVLSAQGAIFRPGSYFGDLPVGYQLIAGAHLLLP